MLINATGAIRAIAGVIQPLLMKGSHIDREWQPWRTKFGRDDRGPRARAASRGEPARRAIPGGPGWKGRAANRARKASPVRKDLAANRVRRASPARRDRRARVAKRARPANCRRSNR